MIIRDATPADWPSIYPIFSAIVEAGETYAYPDGLTSDEASALWMGQHRVVVAVDGDDSRRFGHDGPEPTWPRSAHRHRQLHGRP